MAEDAPRPAFRLRIGQQYLDAGAAPDAVLAFVDNANRPRRIEGLPDTLNPQIIDPEKAAHFAAGLGRLPSATLAKLAGHDLVLDNYALKIQAASPSHAASFDHPFDLAVEEVTGKNVFARATVPADTDLARSRAAEARERTASLDGEVKRLEAAGPGAALSDAKWRRLATARAWRMNAQAWSDAAPGAHDASVSLREAVQAARAFAMPPREGTVPG